MSAPAVSVPSASRPTRRPRCRRVGLALLCEHRIGLEQPQPPATAPPRQVEAWVPSEYAG